MKQVIVRIRECRHTYTKTIKTFYFYNYASYEFDAYDYLKDLMPGQEIYIKVGNKYAKFISYEDVENAMKEDNCDDFDYELYTMLHYDSNLNWWLKEYLPLY